MSGTTERKPSGAGREIRLAAVGDLHFDGTRQGTLRDLFSEIDRSADILALCGDLTTHGRPDQMRAFIDELAGVRIPIVGVLGNHEHDEDIAVEMVAMLRARGVHVLDGESAIIEGIGFAGTKGFAGGFGRGSLAPFGERIIKDFVQAAIDESIKLENALRNLRTETKVVLLHFSPIVETVLGEPEHIYPFLGSSRLLEPLETFGATVIFHGHAHRGQLSGATPSGVPVYNVALPLLAENGHRFVVWTSPAPERRHAEREPAEPHASTASQRG